MNDFLSMCTKTYKQSPFTNTEQFVVFLNTKTGYYENHHVNFTGTKQQAENYAYEHNYGGGLFIYTKKK